MDRKYKKANFGHYLWIFHFLDLQIPHMETNRMALPFRYHFVPIPESETTFVEVSNHLPPFCHFVILSKLVRYVRLDIRLTRTTAGYSLVKAQNLARRARGWVPAISAPNKTLGGDCWRDEETRVEMREYARYLSM